MKRTRLGKILCDTFAIFKRIAKFIQGIYIPVVNGLQKPFDTLLRSYWIKIVISRQMSFGKSFHCICTTTITRGDTGILESLVRHTAIKLIS